MRWCQGRGRQWMNEWMLSYKRGWNKIWKVWTVEMSFINTYKTMQAVIKKSIWIHKCPLIPLIILFWLPRVTCHVKVINNIYSRCDRGATSCTNVQKSFPKQSFHCLLCNRIHIYTLCIYIYTHNPFCLSQLLYACRPSTSYMPVPKAS